MNRSYRWVRWSRSMRIIKSFKELWSSSSSVVKMTRTNPNRISSRSSRLTPKMVSLTSMGDCRKREVRRPDAESPRSKRNRTLRSWRKEWPEHRIPLKSWSKRSWQLTQHSSWTRSPRHWSPSQEGKMSSTLFGRMVTFYKSWTKSSLTKLTLKVRRTSLKPWR